MSLHLDASRRTRPETGAHGAADGPPGALGSGAPPGDVPPSDVPPSDAPPPRAGPSGAGDAATRSPGRRAVMRTALLLGGGALATAVLGRTLAQDGSTPATAPSGGPDTTPAPAPTADPGPVAVLGPLLWSDEFDGPEGSGVDLDRWAPQRGAGGWGNGELQAYTDDPANLDLDGSGNLRITVRAQATTDDRGNTAAFTSARLQTVEATEVGRLEARIKVPAGPGLWAAFWTLGGDHPVVGWPGSGEIDVMETYDSALEAESVVHAAGDAGDGTDRWRSLDREPAEVGTLADDFHLYAVDVTADELSFSIDGDVHHVVRRSDLSGGQEWPFDQPQYVLLNVAVSRWAPADAGSSMPASMLVDHVRVYGR